jgi:hypothetical protein
MLENNHLKPDGYRKNAYKDICSFGGFRGIKGTWMT